MNCMEIPVVIIEGSASRPILDGSCLCVRWCCCEPFRTNGSSSMSSLPLAPRSLSDSDPYLCEPCEALQPERPSLPRDTMMKRTASVWRALEDFGADGGDSSSDEVGTSSSSSSSSSSTTDVKPVEVQRRHRRRELEEERLSF
mmetsp:Transcript_61945/g.147778  ORF Transcript_61945/g.147778 Transcript_61945/m.147778 type:complete len:143 (+) Transcript_61945:157-585(+)